MPLALRFSSIISLQEHFDNHRTDFAVINEDDYLRKAIAFLQNPLVVPVDHTELKECTRLSGDIIRYNVVTHHFAVVSPSGIIRTYFIPTPRSLAPPTKPVEQTHKFTTNFQYFKSECQQ